MFSYFLYYCVYHVYQRIASPVTYPLKACTIHTLIKKTTGIAQIFFKTFILLVVGGGGKVGEGGLFWFFVRFCFGLFSFSFPFCFSCFSVFVLL